MGKRGPKAVDLGLLNAWEFEWYKAFHVLRDGTAVPHGHAVLAPPQSISAKQIQGWIERLRKMYADEYLRINALACERISGEKGPALGVSDVEISTQREWAHSQKESEIRELERYLNPSKIPAETERRDLWESLWRTQTVTALKKACDQWASLGDVRAQSLRVFPNYVLAHAREFLRMKRDVRFPKSDSPAVDESRLEYLARGMAGILANVSPMTGIERLRNFRHTPGGPLWKADPDGRGYCNCWRCRLTRSRPAYRISAVGWWNGMALFMEIAETRKKTR